MESPAYFLYLYFKDAKMLLLKKHISKYIVILILDCICINIHAQWFYQNPKPTGEELNTIHFVDSLTGWTAGTWSLLHTSDGGTNWEYQYPGSFYSSPRIYFIDQENGWVAGGKNKIYHTSDGGNSWDVQPWSTGSTWEYLNDISFFDSMNGWAVGQAYDNGSPYNYIILHTSNGGNSWEVQIKAQGSSLQGVFFTDLFKGWAVGNDGKILMTTDGGTTWTLYQNSWVDIQIQSVFFIDDLSGWACGWGTYPGHYGYVLHTNNGGATWNIQDTVANLNFLDIQFTSSQTGYICGGIYQGNAGVVYSTNDGGNKWSLCADDSIQYLTSISIPDTIHMYSAGLQGSLMKSADGGNNWWHLDQRVKLSNRYYNTSKITFSDSLHGWIAGSDSAILRTRDGGAQWERILTTNGLLVYSASFIDDSTGWTITSKYTQFNISKTTDGGLTWTDQCSVTNNGFLDICFISSTTGWVSGYNGVIMRTMDGGNTWITQDSTWGIRLYSIFFIDSQHGWAAGEDPYFQNGVILRTANGGGTWETQLINQYSFNSVCFSDTLHGWLVSAGSFYKTDNGGITWDTIGYAPFWMTSVTCSDSLHVYIVGEFGAIFYSSDGGKTWTYQTSKTGNVLQSVLALDSLNVYALAENGVIIHTSNGGGFPVGIKEINPIVSKNILQSSVYPNPALSGTTIEVNIDKTEDLEIRLYNLLGRLVYLKKYSNAPSGKNKFAVNVSAFKPGVYFCRISAGSKTNSVKVIVGNN